MATFDFFSNILPDPIHRITDQGDEWDGSTAVPSHEGPGFAALDFTSNADTQVSRTISGRGVTRDQGGQYWSFNIQYNPLFRENFEPVEAFLASRNARRDPFFVVLPQYTQPRNTQFANFCKNNEINVKGFIQAGKSSFIIESIPANMGSPSMGDKFTISDPDNVNHLKVYSITRVETNARHQTGMPVPAITERRIHFSPPLQRNTSSGSEVNFIEPKFRVIATSDLREYDLNTDNLYSFSLSLEEIQP